MKLRLFNKIGTFLTNIWLISSSSFNNLQKINVYKTFLRITISALFGQKTKKMNIVGNTVSFFSFESQKLLFTEIFIHQDYCFVTENKEPLIIDCGSNIGMSILFFKMLYPQSRIIGFEPDYKTFSYLAKNITDNKVESVQLHRVALSSHKGEVDFYYDQETPGRLKMSLIQERLPKHFQRVASDLLSNYVIEDVDLLKLDVEGVELDVVEELHSSGKIYRIKQMIIEYHHHIDVEADRFSKLLSVLEDSGFGYQISTLSTRHFKHRQFQDILVHAYRK